MSWLRTPTTLNLPSGKLQIVATPTGVLLDVQGVERGTDGHNRRSHSYIRLDTPAVKALAAVLLAFPQPTDSKCR